MSVLTIVDQKVTASSSCEIKTTFIGILGKTKFSVNAEAVAVWDSGTGNAPCLLALHPSSPEALYLDSNAKVDAQSCSVHSNSSNIKGTAAYSNSYINAASNCVVGSASGGSSHYSPNVVTGCDTIADPLAGIAPPNVGSCDYNNAEYDSVSTILSPGVYCGGLTIKGNAVITFRSGTYVIKNSSFFVDSNSRISGTGVGFYLTGSDAVLHFTSNSSVNLVAPSTGDMAGILFFEDRSVSADQTHYFDSNNISRIEGAVYLSRGIFSSDSNTQIGANSAFTTVIARKIQLNSNAILTLNADYSATTVPNVASGYSGATNIRLVK
ncbi:MAG: hypothetical protein GY742_22180 [Hyphomicrobiales bacterium]|nr:hypothetical protein [Hyphomicrobiales bacterium]